MQSSAQILVQRYLEDDLNDYERRAFLEDLSRDPQLAALVEHEAQLDRSIINDAYSIEPPAAIRASVLASIAASPEPALRASRSMALSSILATLVSLWFIVIGTSHNDELINSLRPVTRGTLTSAAVPIPPHALPTKRLSLQTVIPDEVPQAAASELIDAPEESEAQIQRVEIEPVSMNQLVQQQPHMSLASAGLLAAIPTQINGLSGVMGPASLTLRYDVTSTDALRLFVEGGAMGSAQKVQQFSNGLPQQTLQQSIAPFIVVGAEARIAEVPVLQRTLMGSAAIGVSAAGPLGIIDLTAEATEIGPVSVFAGIRVTGTMNLRYRSDITVGAMPFLRVAVGM